MFGRQDPSSNQKRLVARLVLRSGESERAAITHPAHKSLRDWLNDGAPFLEIERPDGARSLLNKSEIARIDPEEEAPRAEPRGRFGDARFDSSDPRVVLGVGATASREEIRAAWRELARRFHPDRLGGLDVPEELLRQAGEILARVNAAYERLSEGGPWGTA